VRVFSVLSIFPLSVQDGLVLEDCLIECHYWHSLGHATNRKKCESKPGIIIASRVHVDLCK